MKTEFDYHYFINYKQPRRSNWSNAEINDVMTIDFKEIDPSTAPIAFVVSDNGVPESVEFSSNGISQSVAHPFKSKDGETIVRFHNGNYYASRCPFTEIAQFRDNPQYDPFNKTFKLHNRRSLETTKKEHYHRPNLSLAEFEDQNPGAKRVESEKELYQKLIHKLIKKFCVIDGIVYEKVWEPALTVIKNPHKSTVTLAIDESISPDLYKFKSGEWHGESKNRVRFGLDQYDKALEFAQSISNEDKFDLTVEAQIHQIDPQYVTFRGDQEFVLMSAKMAINNLKCEIGLLPKPLALATVDCANKLSLHDHMTKPSFAAIEKLFIELSAYVECNNALLGDNFSSIKYYDPKYKYVTHFNDAKLLSYALSRWNSRDISEHEWFDHSLDTLPSFNYPKRAYEVTSKTELQNILRNWDSKFPGDIFDIDTTANAIFVVDDLESRLPSSIHIYPRHNLDQASDMLFRDDDEDISKDLDLLRSLIESDRNYAIRSIGKPKTATVTP